jgi:catechol 2,3-dioxygenase-like lactoylglutathione lyase family enzyme
MIEASGIDHIVLHVSDVQRSKQFYTELLGMTSYRENDRQVFLHAGAQGVALFKKTDSSPVPAGGDMNHRALKVAGGTSNPSSKRMASASPAGPATIIASISRTPTATACS